MSFTIKSFDLSSLTLRRKLFILRIGAGVCLGLFIGMSCFFIATKIFYNTIQKDLESSTYLLNNEVHHALFSTAKTTEQIAQSREVAMYYQSDRVTPLLTLFSRFSNAFEKIAYIDNEGVVDVSVVGMESIQDIDETDVSEGFVQASTKPNTLVVGDIVYDKDVQALVHQFYYQYTDFFDNSLGTIRVTLSLEMFANYLDTMLGAEQIRFLIVTDKHNRIIYSKDRELVGQDASGLFSNEMLNSKTLEEVYLGRQKVLGSSFLTATLPLNDLGWNIFVLEPTTDFTMQLTLLFGWFLFATVGAILLAEVISKKLGLRITEPITKLQEVTSTILQDGNLEKRVEWHSKDEMGMLSNSFNSMLEKLNLAQKKISAEQQFVENIMHSMTEFLIVISPQFGIMKINSSAGVLLGYEEEELLGQPFNTIVPSFHSFTNKQCIPQIDLVTKECVTIPVTINISALKSPQQKSIGYLVIGKDIREELRLNEEKRKAVDELKDAQEDLLKTEKLAIVGQMSGMVAHEVLNPVSAIYTRLDLNFREHKKVEQINQLLIKIADNLQQELADGTIEQYCEEKGHKEIPLLKKIAESIVKKGEEQAESLDFCNKLIHRVVRIIDNLREMSRHEKSIELVNVSKLIDEVIEDMSDGLHKRGIVVEKNYHSDPNLYADYMEMYSIFSNLLKNGVQAIDGLESVVHKTITIELAHDDNMISTQITDTGVGVDIDAQELLFKTGFSNKGREGTGLGLSYSRRIARETGGDIVLARTAQGKGSTFLVTLKIQKEH